MRSKHPLDPSLKNYHNTVGNLRGTGNKNRSENVILLEGEEDTLDNYRIGFNTSGLDVDDYVNPRHRHLFDQVRYVHEGDYQLARNTMVPPGWAVYIPAGAFYGPLIKHPNCALVGIQFGAANRQGYYSIRQRKQAHDDLMADPRGGRLEGGMYIWTDENGKRHNEDATFAAWEKFKHTPNMRYTEPQYPGFILMNPEAFEWKSDEESPGVARKTMGTFTGNDLRVGFVKVDAGASLRFGTENSNELMMLIHGTVTHDGSKHEELTAFSSSAAERPETLNAIEDAEFFYVKLPTFS